MDIDTEIIAIDMGRIKAEKRQTSGSLKTDNNPRHATSFINLPSPGRRKVGLHIKVGEPSSVRSAAAQHQLQRTWLASKGTITQTSLASPAAAAKHYRKKSSFLFHLSFKSIITSFLSMAKGGDLCPSNSSTSPSKIRNGRKTSSASATPVIRLVMSVAR